MTIVLVLHCDLVSLLIKRVKKNKLIYIYIYIYWTQLATKKLNTKMAEAKTHTNRNIIIEKWKKIDRENSQ